MENKQHIKIHIADASPLDLNIAPEKEEMTRQIMRNVNLLWSQWCDTYREKSSRDILAMVTFRYAQAYYELVAKVNANENALADVEEAFDRILLDVK